MNLQTQMLKKRKTLTLLQKSKFVFLVLVLCINIFSAKTTTAQEYPDSLDQRKLKLLILGTAVGNAATMAALGNIWYADQPGQKFAFFDDSREWKQMDKIGHTLSSYYISDMYFKALQGVGLSKKKSNFWSALIGFLLISQVEIFDGFSAGYGASWSDIGFNAAGAGLAFAQHHYLEKPFIYPKYSFRRSSLAGIRPSLLGNGLQEEWIKDYNGQTYWLSFDMHQIWTSFPRWLNIAVGYGAHNMIFADDQANINAGYDPYRQYFFSIDFDFSYLKTNSKLLNTLIYFVNMIHLPAPALEFNRVGGFQWHWLYF